MSSTSVGFHIAGWSAWAPGRETEADWRNWAQAAPGADEPASPPALPLLLRRRVSAIGQKALRAAWGLPDVTTARLVFASRHGEFARTLSIMDSLAAKSEVSPADFSLSVHHALAGLLSIATGNRQGHTAVAAGPDSFLYGLLEAAACLAEAPGRTVVLVYHDDPLPTPYDRFGHPADQPLALALALSATGAEPGMCLTMSPVPPAPGDGAVTTVTPALDFLCYLLGNNREAIISGSHHAWHLETLDAPL